MAEQENKRLPGTQQSRSHVCYPTEKRSYCRAIRWSQRMDLKSHQFGMVWRHYHGHHPSDSSVPFLVLPALKPNQPNHSKAVPRATKGTLWGRSWSLRHSVAGHARSKPRDGRFPAQTPGVHPDSESHQRVSNETCSRMLKTKKGHGHRLPMSTPHNHHQSSRIFRFQRALPNSVYDSMPTPHATPPNHPKLLVVLQFFLGDFSLAHHNQAGQG